MKRIAISLLFAAQLQTALAIQPPAGVVTRVGDQSVVLHWEANAETDLAGYRVYRSTASGGPFTLLTSTLLTIRGYCDLNVFNGQTNYYQVTAVNTASQESSPSPTLAVVPHAFANDDEFLEYVQQCHFDYFWYGGNPANGMVPDRLPNPAPCSIAAVGFGLTAIGIGVDHGWITRSQGVARVLTTLNTFYQGPQGPGTSGTIGYNGWFYHFLDMNTALRYTPFNSELSSIDTTWLLSGVLYAKQFFNGTNADETQIRALADGIFSRLDWNWMARGTDVLSMGWQPVGGFLSANWIGYDEGMMIYLLGLGSATNPLPATAWSRWTSGYTWATYYGQSYVPFPPLFGHQYSHCWVDFRHQTDAYMLSHTNTYFENSRRATLAQRAYCIANPIGRVGYSSNVWGLTACDGPPPAGYQARGAPPTQNDDGTIAPTAAGGSIAFAPEVCLPTLKYFYSHFRRSVWTAFGFRDAFNQGAQWWDTDQIGIDQGPIVIMIENYRRQSVWKLFMQNPEIQRGLQRAGFVPLASVTPAVQPFPLQNAVSLTWAAPTGGTYGVEYSPDLAAWFFPTGGPVVVPGPTATWTDNGPPGTSAFPFDATQRFYRVFQFGTP